MVERLWSVEVFNIDITTGKLIVRRKKREADKITDVLTTFYVMKGTQIKDRAGKIIQLSELKAGDRITVDYIKENDGTLVAPMISLFRRS